MLNPISSPDIIGAQYEISGEEDQANQKKEIAKRGPESITTSSRNSGGTGSGANLLASRLYLGLKNVIY